MVYRMAAILTPSPTARLLRCYTWLAFYLGGGGATLSFRPNQKQVYCHRYEVFAARGVMFP
jgi:hypothetical protein